jgi:hypothetical protein
LKAIGVITGTYDSYKHKGAHGFYLFANQCKEEICSRVELVQKPFKPKAIQSSTFHIALSKKRKAPETDSSMKENNGWELFKGEGAFKRVNTLVDMTQP